MIDHADNLIEALVACRENGMSRDECRALVRDTFNAPWSAKWPSSPLNSKQTRKCHELLDQKRQARPQRTG